MPVGLLHNGLTRIEINVEIRRLIGRHGNAPAADLSAGNLDAGSGFAREQQRVHAAVAGQHHAVEAAIALVVGYRGVGIVIEQDDANLLIGPGWNHRPAAQLRQKAARRGRAQKIHLHRAVMQVGSQIHEAGIIVTSVGVGVGFNVHHGYKHVAKIAIRWSTCRRVAERSIDGASGLAAKRAAVISAATACQNQ